MTNNSYHSCERHQRVLFQARVKERPLNGTRVYSHHNNPMMEKLDAYNSRRKIETHWNTRVEQKLTEMIVELPGVRGESSSYPTAAFLTFP